jgi:hypothetical protein
MMCHVKYRSLVGARELPGPSAITVNFDVVVLSSFEEIQHSKLLISIFAIDRIPTRFEGAGAILLATEPRVGVRGERGVLP